MDVVVVGAGIVGMSVALSLQAEGHRVVVLDRSEPGLGASFGNAGLIASEMSRPLVTPQTLRSLPTMIFDAFSPITIRPHYLPAMAGWLARLVLATRPGKVAKTSDALGRLLDLAADAFTPLLERTASQDLLRCVERLAVYSSDAAYRSYSATRDEWKRRGIAYREIPRSEALTLEPGLAPVFERAVLLEQGRFISSPKGLVDRFVAAFCGKGGVLAREEVTRVVSGGPGATVTTDHAVRRADRVVVCAGAWSHRICRTFGLSVPLEAERGYHVMLRPPAGGLGRPVAWPDRYLHLIPMGEEVRLVTGLEFAGLEAGPDYRRVDRLAEVARLLLPTLKGEPVSRWLGFRPGLPDSLPMIGAVPGHDGILLCFGHHHLGLTLGPLCGRIVADLIAGRTPPLDLAPYRPGRSMIL
jgi:D-amino-acid dehydrogenase